MNILVSACLLGVNCRYDGGNCRNEQVLALRKRHHLIPICPEQLGGLKTPREPSQRKGEQVVSQKGEDVTKAYWQGAREALRLAELFGCKHAILKERSPSCGKGIIYDGSFTGKKVAGDGVAAQFLQEHGISVIGESQAGELAEG